MTPDELVEGLDYYIENGLMVFTERYLRNRGFCCRSGCRHCPYEDSNSASSRANEGIVNSRLSIAISPSDCSRLRLRDTKCRLIEDKLAGLKSPLHQPRHDEGHFCMRESGEDCHVVQQRLQSLAVHHQEESFASRGPQLPGRAANRNSG